MVTNMQLESLKRFYYSPFEMADKLNLTIKGNNLNIFQKYKRLRNSALGLALFSLGAWIVLGFDSTIGQLIHFLYAMPSFLAGQLTVNQWTTIFFDQYGKEMHWSAFVFYGLCFYFLSRHFEGMGITKSKNVSYSLALTLFSVGVFEFYWMASFAYFQNQPWVISPRWPQLRIILQNVAFVAVGVLGALYMWCDSYIFKDGKATEQRRWRFNWNWKAGLLLSACVVTAVLWWYYPLPVEKFSVELETGVVWTNTNRFPQTLYTIDLDPTDNVNAGVWYWIENNYIHAINTLVKVLWTFTFFYVGKLKMEKKT